MIKGVRTKNKKNWEASGVFGMVEPLGLLLHRLIRENLDTSLERKEEHAGLDTRNKRLKDSGSQIWEVVLE